MKLFLLVVVGGAIGASTGYLASVVLDQFLGLPSWIGSVVAMLLSVLAGVKFALWHDRCDAAEQDARHHERLDN